MKKFKWSKIKKPVFVMAPMADITILPFRSVCKEMGADIVYTPMIVSDAVVHNPEHALKIAKFSEDEQPLIVQLCGYSGDVISKAIDIIHENIQPAGIDINLGCPSYKITKNLSGSALLKDFDTCKQVLSTVRKNYKGQLSVKLRTGWMKYDILDFAKDLENLGIDEITVHGRTSRQKYEGKADWDPIYELAENLNIPVIGNGDVTTWQTATARADKGDIAGVMIARGALGRPWIFREIKSKRDFNPTRKELADIIRLHTKRYVEYIGEERAIREMRKHLAWYIRDFEDASAIRQKAVQSLSTDDIEKVCLMVAKAN
jgi:tRNA-dihydrouridine synthase B